MKTSNKILLGILLVAFGYIACSQIALHVKYKNNNFTAPGEYNAFFYDQYGFKNIRHVRINGIADCQVISSDSIKLSIEKSSFNYVGYKVNADTLIVFVEHGTERSADDKLNRSPQNIKLYLPATIDISALNSNIWIKGNRNPASLRSYHIDLTACNLFTRRNIGMDSLGRYFDTMQVNARKDSRISLFYNDHFNNITTRLDHSVINDYHAKIDHADIVTDSSSTLVFSGDNMSKLNVTRIKK